MMEWCGGKQHWRVKKNLFFFPFLLGCHVLSPGFSILPKCLYPQSSPRRQVCFHLQMRKPSGRVRALYRGTEGGSIKPVLSPFMRPL